MADFKTRGLKKRPVGTREENEVQTRESSNLVFSLRYLNQCPPGQTIEDWQKDGILSKAVQLLAKISNFTRDEAIKNKVLSLYTTYPSNSCFNKPEQTPADAAWGVLKKINGQKTRIAGFLNRNIFYIVFLDKEHKFAPSSKK